MADVTVASTTDSIEEVRSAAGLPAEEQQGELEVEGTITETVEADSAEVEQEQAEGEDAELESKPAQRPKTSVQKRIDKLTAKNYQLEEEKEQARGETRELRERLERLEKIANSQTKVEEPTVSAGKPRPVAKDFEDYDKYVDALTDWKIEQKELSAKADQQKAQAAKAEERQKEVFSAYNKAVSEARGQHEDFDEVVGNPDLLVPQAVQIAIVGMRAEGPEVAYQLASNPELCAKLSEIAVDDGDAAALVAFGKWVANNFDEPAAERTAAPVRKLSAKPAPITPVRSGGTRTNVPMDELEYSDYRRIRDEQEKAKRRH